MRRTLLLIVFGSSLGAAAQLDSAFHISGYAEVYYSLDAAVPDDHLRPGFLYNFNRSNEVNLNLGLLQFDYARDRVRGSLGLMAGTYAQANLAQEPVMLRSVYQANVGVKLSNTRALWLDGGILPSHIGFESAVGKDCWTLTRSLVAENTPYYEAGVRLGYASPGERWYVAALILNGWQRITRSTGSNIPAGGTQVTFTPSKQLTVNWSTFFGNMGPDDVSRLRVFNNFYVQAQVNERLGVIAGCDAGTQETADGSSVWVTPTVIARFAFSERSAVAARLEFYHDPDGAVIATGTPSGFSTGGASVNYDRWVSPEVLWRIEARALQSADPIFSDRDGRATELNAAVTTSLAVVFGGR